MIGLRCYYILFNKSWKGVMCSPEIRPTHVFQLNTIIMSHVASKSGFLQGFKCFIMYLKELLSKQIVLAYAKICGKGKKASGFQFLGYKIK